MNKKRTLEYSIKNNIYSKNLSKYKINKIYILLDEYMSLDNYDINFYHIQKANLLFRLNKIEEAKEELKFANKSNAYYYYLLFKINIKENNLESARENLKLYKTNHTKQEVNISLCTYLLNLLIDGKSNINIEVTNFYNGSEISNKYILNMLGKISDSIIKENYIEARKSIIKSQFYINENNIEADFTELLALVNHFIEKRKFADIHDLIKKAYEYISNKDFEEANYILCDIKNHPKFKHSSEDYKFLKIYLNEELKIKSIINSDLGKTYENINMWVDIHSSYNDEYSTLQYYLYGIYITNLPEFYYKTGVYYFNIGNQKEAVKYFLGYIHNGGFKYLYEIYEYLSNCKSVLNFKERKTYKLKKHVIWQFLLKVDKYKEYFELYPDIYSYKLTNNMYFRFASLSNEQILDDIKYLYENGYIELAEVLYREFNEFFSDDLSVRKSKNYIDSNRIVYINRRIK